MTPPNSIALDSNLYLTLLPPLSFTHLSPSSPKSDPLSLARLHITSQKFVEPGQKVGSLSPPQRSVSNDEGGNVSPPLPPYTTVTKFIYPAAVRHEAEPERENPPPEKSKRSTRRRRHGVFLNPRGVRTSRAVRACVPSFNLKAEYHILKIYRATKSRNVKMLCKVSNSRSVYVKGAI